MKKIFITGNAGSGKTTLAKRVGALLDLPVVGLDIITWQPGWRKSPADWRAQRLSELVSQSAWVIEGVSLTVIDAADFVIFLDVDRRTSLFRCAWRNVKYLFRSRPELPESCPEILIIPTLVRIIGTFRTRVRPQIITALATRQQNSRIVRTPHEREAVLTELTSAQQTPSIRP